MKSIFIVAISIIIGGAIFILSGCVPKSGSYGEQLSLSSVTRVSDIFKSPLSFKGKAVRLEGTVKEECPTGGWFMFKDDTGVIFVNLHPSEFAIPQASGSKAAVEGVVITEGPQPSIIGKGVKIK
ncbi:MAG: hypothetical protein NT060_03850 [Candidatus Omnitrophica bacterium]|nr:hypothetical protein [Candidatus Omnitrophota bacterium]